ncbi:MAG: hypothetical protein AAF960_26490 [Bacteroidota bacterium]
MGKYVQQLLENLEHIKKVPPPQTDYANLYPNHPALEYGLDYIVEWEMAPQVSMNELFQFEAANFPPAEKLTSPQMQALVDKILEVWAAFNFWATLHEGLPIDKVYTVLAKFWKEEPVTYVSEGHCELELCNYVVENCPWGEAFCDCKKNLAEMEDFEMEPVDEEWWNKGLQKNPDGSSAGWINPDLLDENGKLKDFPKWNSEDGDLPF